MLLEESGGVNARSRGDTVPPPRSPPLPRRRCELPGVGPECLGSRGQSRGASGAGLCESLLKRFTMDLIYSDLELCHGKHMSGEHSKHTRREKK